MVIILYFPISGLMMDSGTARVINKPRLPSHQEGPGLQQGWHLEADILGQVEPED